MGCRVLQKPFPKIFYVVDYVFLDPIYIFYILSILTLTSLAWHHYCIFAITKPFLRWPILIHFFQQCLNWNIWFFFEIDWNINIKLNFQRIYWKITYNCKIYIWLCCYRPRTHNQLVGKRTLNHLAKLASGLWVLVPLQSIYFQISRLFWARSSSTFKQL